MGLGRRLRRWATAAAVVAGVVLATVTGLVFATAWRPPPRAPVTPATTGPAAPLVPGEPFTVVSWNLQFGGSRKHHFFYDGGDAVSVPPADVAETTAGIAATLTRLGPDLALLQEVDRDSARTGRVDQHSLYAAALGAPVHLSTPYHRSPFVPKPLTDPLGRVDLHLSAFSRHAVSAATRIQLPLQPANPVVQAFTLKRCLLHLDLPIRGAAHPLAVGLTHLDAFTYGDGTLDRQVDALLAWVHARPPGQPWVLAGDFNLLPPGDDRTRLPAKEAALYADDPNPLARVWPRLTEAFGPDLLRPEARTYLPFASAAPDRKIDYLFVGGPIEVLSAAVDDAGPRWSDHLPLRVVVRILPGAGNTPA